jgi:hypothetical protein
MNKQFLAVAALALGIIASSSVMAAEKTLTLAVKNMDLRGLSFHRQRQSGSRPRRCQGSGVLQVQDGNGHL